ncbi:hybrid sensor histidine kinase/response regulator [Phormidium tenue]|uniref:histidine kinase n=1 Tax=Phormidium tenue NIES-30 TaxID=549789 RepID=A0A1U7J2W8_9CYAN|nr:response regulator [Phormidium tenue]MBD2233288.1 response regulator [Phormidium tenue FACHB-1052]OKH46542.1 hybrid sensor histidine kinase/response regulator [Phormidium tenue NIES-30]
MVSQAPIHVLLIEDNPGDRRLMQELLREVTSVAIQLDYADSLSQGMQYLKQTTFDVVLLDLFLPDSQGFATFTQLHQQERKTPIIVTTGLNDETLALNAVQAGAQDYLVKGQITGELLVRSIRYAIERKRAEQKIREQAALLDIATDAILVRDPQNQILFWSRGAERLYGWTAAEALGQKTTELLYADDNLVQIQQVQQQLMLDHEWHGELNQVTKTGQAIIVESRWTLVRDDDGQPQFILVVSTDITSKKQLEAQFFRAQRLESIGTLASGIAHDLNNILTPVLATSQLLQMEAFHQDERSLELLQLLEINARRGGDIIKQVLSFARGGEGKNTILQSGHLIREIQQIIRGTFPKSIELRVDICRDLWPVVGNATQLHQVLMNLCVNARDAMPQGGTLKIAAENLTLDEAYTRTNLDAKSGNYVAITVADRGCGIAPELLDRIFEPFFTSKEIGKGTGLGLSTVLGIVKSHHGFITVSSLPNQGTEFKIFLPAVMAADPPAQSPAEVWIGNQELILVVDDEAPIREVTKATLEAYNYRVVTACDGLDAIALYVQHQSDIRLVIMDLMMPALDGATTCRILHKLNPQVQIIAVSGLPHPNAEPTSSVLETQSFLPKPYTVDELLQVVDEALKPKTHRQAGLARQVSLGRCESE